MGSAQSVQSKPLAVSVANTRGYPLTGSVKVLAADESGPDELVRVRPAQARAGRTDRLAPVATREEAGARPRRPTHTSSAVPVAWRRLTSTTDINGAGRGHPCTAGRGRPDGAITPLGCAPIELLKRCSLGRGLSVDSSRLT